jgi:hypothetical protein
MYRIKKMASSELFCPLEIWRVQTFSPPQNMAALDFIFLKNILRRIYLFKNVANFRLFFSSKYGDFGVLFPKKSFVTFALDFFCGRHAAKFRHQKGKKKKKHQDWRRVTIDEKTS